MKQRAYSLLTIKSMDDDERIIEGVATTPSTDRVGDIVESAGAEYTLPLPLLWQHQSSQPIGHVTAAKVTKDGITITAKLVKIDEPGTLKDRLDEAWQSLKSGLVRGLSIGFQPIESLRIEGTWSYRYVKWAWYELSTVTIPANAEANIQTVKSIDTTLLAASGQKQFAVVRLTPPGVTGKSQPTTTPKEGKNMKISEKIARFEQKRSASMARIAAIHEETDESLTDAQLEEIKGLEAECDTIDRDLPSLKRAEKALADTAKPIVRAVESDDAGAGGAAQRVSIKAQPKLEPGIAFARYVKAKMVARLDVENVISVAGKMYGKESDLVGLFTKANEVAAGTTLSGNWAADLIGAETSMFADFAAYLRPATILGKFGVGGVPGLRKVAFRMPLISQTGGGAGYWVGEGKPKPLTSFDFDRTTLSPLKVANIAVLTEENIRYSSPSSDAIVRDSLRDALVETQDIAFIDPTNSGSANVKPASITDGAEAIAAPGTGDADDIRLGVRAVFQKFIDANNPPEQGVWLMSASNALALSLMLNALGQREFPNISMNGGTFEGLPVIVSQRLGSYVVLVNASDIYEADEGEIAVDMSREASLEMKSATLSQDGTAGTGASLVSMFQNNLVAIRAEKTINWKRRRSSAVAYLTGAVWGGAVPAS